MNINRWMLFPYYTYTQKNKVTLMWVAGVELFCRTPTSFLKLKRKNNNWEEEKKEKSIRLETAPTLPAELNVRKLFRARTKRPKAVRTLCYRSLTDHLKKTDIWKRILQTMVKRMRKHHFVFFANGRR